MMDKPLISIVVCSVNQDLRNSLVQNIRETIGVTFEFLFYDNKNSTKGICKVYNDLAEESKGDFICFIHEDVIIETQNWGTILINQAKNDHVGVVGFAGAKVFRGLPYWYHKDEIVFNLIQRIKDGAVYADFTTKNSFEKNEFQEVKVLDGMFLFCRRSVWEFQKFDDTLFKKFHMYDIDFSFMNSLIYKNYVCDSVIINHYSLGKLNKDYFDELINGYKKWGPYFLPENKLSNRDLKFIIQQVINDLLYNLNLPFLYIFNFLSQMDILNRVNYFYALCYFFRIKLGKVYKKFIT